MSCSSTNARFRSSSLEKKKMNLESTCKDQKKYTEYPHRRHRRLLSFASTLDGLSLGRQPQRSWPCK